MYKYGDLIIFHGLIYVLNPWKSCFECSMGYDDECECLVPFFHCHQSDDVQFQLNFYREATDEEFKTYANWAVVGHIDDEQLIML